MNPKLTPTLLFGASMMTGCAPPPFMELMAKHRDGEALCRASTPDEARLVIPRMIAASKASWRVRRIQRTDLPDLNDAIANELFGRYVFVLIETKLTDAGAS